MRAHIIIPIKAISFNNYQRSTANGRRYTTVAGKSFGNTISLYAKTSVDMQLLKKKVDSDEKLTLSAQYIFHFKNLYKKDDTINKSVPDVDNPIKICQDAIFKALELDDRRVTHLTARKEQSDRDLIEVVLEINNLKIS